MRALNRLRYVLTGEFDMMYIFYIRFEIKLQKKALIAYYFRLGYMSKVIRRILNDPRCIKFYFEPAVILLKWIRLGK